MLVAAALAAMLLVAAALSGCSDSLWRGTAPDAGDKGGPGLAGKTRDPSAGGRGTAGTGEGPGATETSATETSATPPDETPPAKLLVFSASRALSHVTHLASKIGPRPEGRGGEERAAAYISSTLARYGYKPANQAVRLPVGRRSGNVVAVKKGASSAQLVLGAHYDSKAGSPGANDNASGVGALLELARVLKDADTQPTVVFVFFGAEEMIDSNPDHHHYGSRQYVEHLTSAQRANIAGMISVDMIGYGTSFQMRTMGKGPDSIRAMLHSFARRSGIRAERLRDLGRYGWSDHEPFELAGVPAVWVEWRDDPVYHTSRDTAGHISTARLRTTGLLLQKFVTSLSKKNVESLLTADR